MTGVAWTAWVHEWVPQPVYSAFFSQRNRLSALTAVGFTLVAGLLLQWSPPGVSIFAWLLLAATALRGFGWLLSRRIQGGLLSAPENERLFSAQIALVWKNRAFLRLTIFEMAVGFTLGAFGSFVPVFMMQQLGQSTGQIGFCAALATSVGALVYPTWGRLADRIGNKNVVFLALALWMGSNGAWCFLTPNYRWLTYLIWAASGAATPGIVLGKFNLLLKLVPAEAKTTAIGIFTMAASLFTAIAPILAGYLLGMGSTTSEPSTEAFRLFFAAQPLLLIGVLYLLFRVDEPSAAPFVQMVSMLVKSSKSAMERISKVGSRS
jgi:Na+/melibiose symporter-like transporter